MLKIVHAAAGLGITHYRITGGEPLVRKECVELVQKIDVYKRQSFYGASKI